MVERNAPNHSTRKSRYVSAAAMRVSALRVDGGSIGLGESAGEGTGAVLTKMDPILV
jgi:hypothetical protein